MARQILNLGAAANDKTGTTARAGGRIINENFQEVYQKLEILTRIDIIVEANGFSLIGNQLTINAGWQWIINNVEFSNIEDVVKNILFSAAGNSRMVYVVPNEENGFDLVDGEEATMVPPTPELPNGGMYVTRFRVFDAYIGVPEPYFDGDEVASKITTLQTKRFAGSGQEYELPADAVAFKGWINDAVQHAQQPGFETDLNTFTQLGTTVTFKKTIAAGQRILIDYYI